MVFLKIQKVTIIEVVNKKIIEEANPSWLIKKLMTRHVQLKFALLKIKVVATDIIIFYYYQN